METFLAGSALEFDALDEEFVNLLQGGLKVCKFIVETHNLMKEAKRKRTEEAIKPGKEVCHGIDA